MIKMQHYLTDLIKQPYVQRSMPMLVYTQMPELQGIQLKMVTVLTQRLSLGGSPMITHMQQGQAAILCNMDLLPN
jgi:hypothetical protein